MERWARNLDSWAICDAACCVLFDRTPYAVEKARAWATREEEYVKRAAFSIVAGLAVHAKDAPESLFVSLLTLVPKAADDDRNNVKKGVNWALRAIGKRSLALHEAAVKTAEEIRARGTRSARWIAADALRELRNPATLERLRDRAVTTGSERESRRRAPTKPERTASRGKR
jgi:3-methyladenine DNA glycosylase AlkD